MLILLHVTSSIINLQLSGVYLPIDFSFAKVITHYFLFTFAFHFMLFISQFASLAYELRPLASQLTRC